MASSRPPPASSSVSTSAAARGSYSVFVYGPLMVDEVVSIFLGRVPPSSPAVLQNHQRFCTEGRIYPAVVPVAGKIVTGKVFRGITTKELSVLDRLKVGHGEFERKAVEISIPGMLERSLAYTYIWFKKNDPELFGVWDFEVWKLLYLEHYQVLAQEFMLQLPFLL
ncbi:hypothetical protein QOZ80_4BG0358280 [Eleusine coracana subsp. coracana]|nr:hypothetical protein QOZ80_4BG0358280 [Eleusine coracana subsp. coracana]